MKLKYVTATATHREMKLRKSLLVCMLFEYKGKVELSEFVLPFEEGMTPEQCVNVFKSAIENVVTSDPSVSNE